MTNGRDQPQLFAAEALNRDLSASAPSPSRQRYRDGEFVRGGPPTTRFFAQPVASVLAFAAQRGGMSPNFLTLCALFLGVASCVGLAFARGAAVLVVAAGLLFAYVLDCADGQLARALERSSPFGAWLDLSCDMVVGSSFAVAIAIRVEHANVVLGFLVGALVACSRTVALLTVALVSRSRTSDWETHGLSGSIRAVYTTVSDTPTVYVCTVLAAWLSTSLLVLVALTQGVLLLAQCLAIGHHAFPRSAEALRST